MIVAGKSQRAKPKVSPIGIRPSKAGYVSGAYEIGKTVAKGYGYYKDIEPYLPDRYIEKYTYKPGKRITGYLGQKLHEKKKLRSSKRRYVYQKRKTLRNRYYWHTKSRTGGESRDVSVTYGDYRRISRVYTQSNILYN